MPGSETVWAANVWEHTRCLAVDGFLLKALFLGSQSCLSAGWLELCEGGWHGACLALNIGPVSQVIWSSPCGGGCGPSLQQPRNFASSLAGRSLSGLQISPARVKRNTTFSRILKQPHLSLIHI